MRSLVGPRAVFGPAVRQVLCACVGIGCFWILLNRVAEVDTAAVLASLARVSAIQWLMAAGATAISFWALGQYDLVMHGLARTGLARNGLPRRRAARAGMTAIALSQTLGFGLFSGALIRWKMLPGLTFSRALALTGAIAGCFLGCWSVIAATASLVAGGPLPMSLSLLAPLMVVGFLVLSFLRPAFRIGGFSLRLPPLRITVRMLILTTVDVIFAALALFVLLPDQMALPFIALLPAFLLALGAGLVSGTPGGVGPFELTLLALLPQVPEPEVLGALFAFRAVYFALPALLALAVLAADHMRTRPCDPPAKARRATVPPLSAARRSETALIRQNDGTILDLAGTAWATRDCGQALVALFDPLRGGAAEAFGVLRTEADERGLVPLIYKCGAETALAARHAGWQVLAIAQEAILSPATFTTEGATRRQLRRKLRTAQRAGVEISQLSGTLPTSALSEVAREWRTRQRGERGVSMGQFCPLYIRNQRTFAAFHKDRLIAFVTFHESRHEMCLDLMRNHGDMPDGTMHALIVAALQDARQRGVARLSLAAVPMAPDSGLPALLGLLARRVYDASAGAGLTRFKSAFGPSWQPLYAAAPCWPALALGLADVARAIHAPDHLPPASEQPRLQSHNHVENYEFASCGTLWHQPELK